MPARCDEAVSPSAGAALRFRRRSFFCTFTVRTAENGEDAMKRLAEGKPDLILMDVVMPGTNGYQLTRSITRDPRYSDVPVIMCTSKGQETDRVWGLRQGARDYVVKPVDTDDLMAKIKSLG